MPDINDYSGLPIPLRTETASAPDNFGDFRAALAPHIVLFATSEANRDALYGGVPAGTLVSSTTTGTVWRRQPDLSWAVLYADTGWVSLASDSFGPLFTNIACQYRAINDVVNLRIDATYTGDPLSRGGNGNIANQLVLSLPSAARPSFNATGSYWVEGSTSGDVVVYGSGGVYVATITASDTLATGARVQAHAAYFRG